MDLTDPAKLRAATTYNAAADNYDAGFWEPYGRGPVARLNLCRGARVLDVACGTGASALPAAEAVGPDGRVVAVDLAENMLQLGRAKAAARGLSNIEFRIGDMTALGYPDRHFDVVICVFGVFFVPDMKALVTELWRMVKPFGKLAITTWGARIFEPMYSQWNEAVRAERPSLRRVQPVGSNDGAGGGRSAVRGCRHCRRGCSCGKRRTATREPGRLVDDRPRLGIAVDRRATGAGGCGANQARQFGLGTQTRGRRG